MLNIRAHHLLCIPRHYSGGYDKAFAKQHKKICVSIRKNPEQKIKVIKGLDDLCAKCPYKKGSICAKTPTENKDVLLSDKKVLEKLKIKENSVHSAKEAFNLSMNKIPSVKILCKTCEMVKSCCTNGFNNTGINNAFRRDLDK